jgi:hypothetical protein
VAKEFQIIHGLRSVITLEDDYEGSANDYEPWSDDDFEPWLEEDEDDWEEIYGDEREKPKTYAAVLKEK